MALRRGIGCSCSLSDGVFAVLVALFWMLPLMPWVSPVPHLVEDLELPAGGMKTSAVAVFLETRHRLVF